MRIRLLRFRGIVPTIVLGALAGLVLGYLWGWEVTLRTAEQKLDRFAGHVRAYADRSAEDARARLQEMNHSPYPACSDAEITYLKQLIYASANLKDAGRIRNGEIQCSALFGHVAHSIAGAGGGYVRPDGARVYRNLPPYRIAGETVIALQSAGSLVVYSPFNLRPLEAPPMHFFITDRDLRTGQTRRLISDVLDQNARTDVFMQSGLVRTSNHIYVTRCEKRYSDCMTAYMSVGDAIASEKVQFRIYIGLSGLCGALLAFGWFMMYRRNRSMEQQLRRAIRRGGLDVAYQPIFDLKTRRVVGAEALARWTDERGVAVRPDVFIRAAEERGFVGEITRAMVHHALSALRQISALVPEFHITVNIAAADLNDQAFLPMVQQAVAQAAVPPRSIGFEITENSWTEWHSAYDASARLREQGHLVYIDDFGTGYSSLASLNNLSVDVLKIDREFTQSIGTQSVKVSILPQILSIASALNLHVVVEGIETEEQARYFAGARQSVMAQGWHFGRPMPLEDLMRLLRVSGAGQPISPAQPTVTGQFEI